MPHSNHKDLGLSLLLELDGEIFPIDNGFWTKFDIKQVQPNENIPHGIKYSLTLHDKNNQRVIGYDNAHGIRTTKSKYKAQRITWDHTHERNRIKVYEFESAAQLLENFWDHVNKTINAS